MLYMCLYMSFIQYWYFFWHILIFPHVMVIKLCDGNDVTATVMIHE